MKKITDAIWLEMITDTGLFVFDFFRKKVS